MARGSKAAYTAQQKRKAAHIEASYEKKGISSEQAEAIAWATVNKQSGGGERSGSGTSTSAAEKAGARRNSAQHAAQTRREKTRPGSLESHTKPELLEQARAKNISGRSAMNKAELILALRKPS